MAVSNFRIILQEKKKKKTKKEIKHYFEFSA